MAGFIRRGAFGGRSFSRTRGATARGLAALAAAATLWCSTSRSSDGGAPSREAPGTGGPPSAEGGTVQALIRPSGDGRARVVLQRGGGTAAAAAPDTARAGNARALAPRDPAGGPPAVHATMRMDTLRAKSQRLDKANGRVPVFENRQFVGTRQVQLDLARLDAAAANQDVDYEPAEPIDPTLFENSLMIRAPKVVNDDRAKGMGKWSFGYLMQQMANTAVTGVSAEEFTLQWLRTWDTQGQVNGWTLGPRPNLAAKITQPWLTASGGQALDLSKAPFKLLAIVNRVDLRKQHGPTDAGEARFVFAMLDGNGKPLKGTVIFEYGVNRVDDVALQAWAREWYDLKNLPLGSPKYNAALEAITEKFAKGGLDPTRANGSTLRQLRTNEFLNQPWQLREFNVSPTSHLLELVTVKQTPDHTLNGQAAVAEYINTQVARNEAEGDRHRVPEKFPAGSKFLAGVSDVPFPNLLIWNGTGAHPQARFNFALNTCSGCHSGETMQVEPKVDPEQHFTHVRPDRQDGDKGAELSKFLTGDPADPEGEGKFTRKDAADGVTPRRFFDLGRRAQDLAELVNNPPELERYREPLQMVH